MKNKYFIDDKLFYKCISLFNKFVHKSISSKPCVKHFEIISLLKIDQSYGPAPSKHEHACVYTKLFRLLAY